MRFVLAVPAVLSLLACSGLFVEPTQGLYDADVTDFDASASCAEQWEVDLDALEDVEAMEVEINEASGNVTFGGELECELTGANFACFVSTSDNVGGAAYAVALVTSTTAEGQWSTSTTFAGDWDLTFECEGADCDILAYEPCDITFRVDGALD